MALQKSLTHVSFILLSILFLQISTIRHTQAEDWPQFLGPMRNGVSSETKLIAAFPASGPQVTWRTKLGVGMSGISVAEGKLWTLFQDSRQQYVVCLNAKDGTEIWKTPVAPVYENSMGNGPRATPAVSNGGVYIYTGEGHLAALDVSSGKLRWTVDVPKSANAQPSEYGMSCSPIVAGSLVIVYAGAGSGSVMAFETQSGKMSWKSGSGNAGYSSPMLMTLAGKQQIVALTAAGVAGLEIASGKTLWASAFPTEYDCNTANPVQLSDDELLISAGENHGSVILQVQASGNEFSAEEIWSSLGKDSQLRAEWQTPIVLDGHLYGLDNSGSAGPITNLVCVRLEDRKTVWQKSRFGKSNLIAADGKLFLTTMDGEVVLVDATPEAFREVSRATVMGTTRQAPALSNGFLFVRDDHEVVCIDVRAK